jgi:hypothetical protein
MMRSRARADEGPHSSSSSSDGGGSGYDMPPGSGLLTGLAVCLQRGGAAARRRLFGPQASKRARAAFVGGPLLVLLLLLVLVWPRGGAFLTDDPTFWELKAASAYDKARCEKLGAGAGAATASPGSGPSSSSSPPTPFSEAVRAALGKRSRRLVLAESNSGFAALTENWVRHWRALRPASSSPPGLLVVALDEAERERLERGGVGTWRDGGGEGAAFQASAQGFFAGHGYLAIVFHKWSLLAQALKVGGGSDAAGGGSSSSSAAPPPLDGVLLTDVDALLFRDPFAYIDTLPVCDAYFTTESGGAALFQREGAWYPEPEPDRGGGGGGASLRPLLRTLFGTIRAGGKSGASASSSSSSSSPGASRSAVRTYVNTGFLYLRSTPAGAAFAQAVADRLRSLPPDGGGYDSDQPVANDVLDEMRVAAEAAGLPSRAVPDVSSVGAPRCAQYGSFSFFVLTPFLFQNGKHAWQDGGLGKVVHEPPFTRHYNFLGGTHDGKVAAMKMDGTWSLTRAEEEDLSCRGAAL